jgi:phage terminase large subunit
MLQRVNWPPDYAQVRLDRAMRLRTICQDYRARDGAKVFYANSGAAGCIAFIEDWCDTFDPRNAGTNKSTSMPFVLFPRQREFIEFVYACYFGEADGLVEKSRDMGATWLCVCFSVWLFLFVEGATIGWGSQDAGQVDKLGDMSSIFEKMRYELRAIPRQFWPAGFSDSCMNYMRIYESKGNSITGECGDDVGRGGRTRVYFKDESAHYVHPEMIEASLGDNTRVQIDISSVNGLGNVFHRKREAGVEWSPGRPAVKGKTNVFVFDWSDHPDKTQEWFNTRRAKAVSEGLLHKFNQEVTRDYAASVEGVLIPAEWVRSAIDAHIRLGIEESEHDDNYGGLDVADEGMDRNALARRKGIVLRYLEEWGERDTGATARRAIAAVDGLRRVSVQYDCIGVGSGVKAEINRLRDDHETVTKLKGIGFVPWNAGAGVLKPDDRVEPGDTKTPLNKDFYFNLKAQGNWQLRRRFEKTHRAIKKLEGDPEQQSFTWDADELISLDSTLPLLRTLQKELSQPVMKKGPKMKLVIDKIGEGSRSPNLHDAVVMCYFPVGNDVYDHMDWV